MKVAHDFQREKRQNLLYLELNALAIVRVSCCVLKYVFLEHHVLFLLFLVKVKLYFGKVKVFASTTTEDVDNVVAGCLKV